MSSRSLSLVTIAVFLLTFGSGCGSVEDEDPLDEPIEITEDIEEDTTWEAATYIVPADLRVNAHLVIEPCSVIMGQNRIHVANGGSIEAVGEKDCPVTFTSTNDTPAAGDWRSVQIYDSADNSNVFDHVVLEYGGNDAGIVRVAADTSFSNTTVRHVQGVGIGHTDGTVSEFSEMSFESVSGRAASIQLDSISAVDGVTTTDVQQDTIGIEGGDSAGGDMTQAATWQPAGIPYEFTSDFFLNDELTVESGTELLAGTNDVRGFVEDGGSLQVNGTEGDPVIIQSVRDTPAPGDWRGIDVRDSANASTLTWTTMRHGGSGSQRGVLNTDAAVDLDNVTFEDNENCDVSDPEELITASESPYDEC